jgi:hypothetical protein
MGRLLRLYPTQDPSWNWQTLSYTEFDQLSAQSVSEFSSSIATNNPDLSRFERDGGLPAVVRVPTRRALHRPRQHR